VAAQGWGESPEIVAFVRAMGEVSARAADTYTFLAEADGVPIATGSLHVHEGVAVLAGASTIPSARRRGAQNALLSARLAFARGHGCDLAVMGALPGSASQRNAERNGFRVAYTRIKWAMGA
jgi:GNAT superfamily N-acetyltransferase